MGRRCDVDQATTTRSLFFVTTQTSSVFSWTNKRSERESEKARKENTWSTHASDCVYCPFRTNCRICGLPLRICCRGLTATQHRRMACMSPIYKYYGLCTFYRFRFGFRRKNANMKSGMRRAFVRVCETESKRMSVGVGLEANQKGKFPQRFFFLFYFFFVVKGKYVLYKPLEPTNIVSHMRIIILLHHRLTISSSACHSVCVLCVNCVP